MIKAIDLLEMSPVIAAIKDDAGLKRCLDTECQVVFMEISVISRTLSQS